MDDCTENSHSRKWKSDSPSVCSEISSKEKYDLESELEERYESLDPVNEGNSIAVQGQRAENRKDSECAGSDNFPLCYSSFELLRHILQISKQKQKIEVMENFMNFSEVKDKQDDKSCNQCEHVEKPSVYDEELNHKE